MAKKRTPSSYPYKPSWQNRFFQAIDKLPVPKPIVAFLLFVAIAFLNHLVPWIEEKLPWGEVDVDQFTFHIWFLVVFLAFDYFLTYSRKAMSIFRPAINVSDKEYSQLTYRFINLPNRGGWIITFVSVPVAAFGFSSSFPLYMQSGLSRSMNLITAVFMFSLVFAFIINFFRQFGLIGWLYAKVKRINIFHLNALYAFAGLTSRTGVFLILTGVLSYLTDVAFAENPQIGSFIFFSALNLAVAIGAFILPLGGIHTRLVEEKERVSKENDQRLEGAYKRLHQRIDKNQLKDMVDSRNSISALLELRHEIERISTWPWEPGTLRNFITALSVPLIAWAIQQILLRTVVK